MPSHQNSKSAQSTVYVLASVDVEEEGLFCGKYKCWDLSVSNAAYLNSLSPFIARGVHPTLFCSYGMFSNLAALKELEKLMPNAEIGAHLHHWNSPPLSQNLPESGYLHQVPVSQVPETLMESKIKQLLALGQKVTGQKLQSFRMGRWDLHKYIFPLLAKFGIKVDASVRPFHAGLSKHACPNHFHAPTDPYYLSTTYGDILEAPLSVAPLTAAFANLPRKINLFSAKLSKWGALPILPVQHPLWVMRYLTNLHLSRGNKTLSITWHSSEMMPGGAPHMQSREQVNRFLKKLAVFFDWLEDTYNVTYITMSQLKNLGLNFPKISSVAPQMDWAYSIN